MRSQTFNDVWEAFSQQYPEISCHLYVSDGMQNFREQPLDIIFRYGALADSSLYAKRLLQCERILCAAPSYLESHEAITCLDDLQHHNCLTFNRLDTQYSNWHFGSEEDSRSVQVLGNIKANDGALIRQFAIEGKGLAYKSALDCLKDLQAGHLVRVLPDIQGEDASVYFVYSDKHYQLDRVQVFLQFCVEYFEGLSASLQAVLRA